MQKHWESLRKVVESSPNLSTCMSTRACGPSLVSTVYVEAVVQWCIRILELSLACGQNLRNKIGTPLDAGTKKSRLFISFFSSNSDRRVFPTRRLIAWELRQADFWNPVYEAELRSRGPYPSAIIRGRSAIAWCRSGPSTQRGQRSSIRLKIGSIASISV